MTEVVNSLETLIIEGLSSTREDSAVHLNSCLMIGRVSAKGPQLRYAESGTPFCSFVLEIDELTNGKVYTTFTPCEIIGKYAEDTSTRIEAGDVLQISGSGNTKVSSTRSRGQR
jgi:single-stranded DNA-binding protein